MKKGFTLIELLAVIVILAIIAVIAVPIVLNIIDDSKKSSELRNADSYLKAAELSIANMALKDKRISEGIHSIKDGNICINDTCTDMLEVEIKGDVPQKGIMIIKNGNITYLSIVLNNKSIVKNNEENLAYHEILTLSALCELQEGYIANMVGSKYSCDFGGGARNFYILELGTAPVSNSTLKSDEVALILEGNYDTTTQPFCDQGGLNPINGKLCKADGLTKKMNEIASVWKKIKRKQIGLPTVEQVIVADGQSEGVYITSLVNSWLYNWPGNENYGKNDSKAYWTSTVYDQYSNQAWYVYYHGAIGLVYVDNITTIGVRPVINIKL